MFNIPVENKPKKPKTVHPWANTIKALYADRIKRAHNSIRNATYPKPKPKKPCPNRVTFTVIGNRMTREFLYCVKLVQGIHTYIWKKYDTPIIRGCTAVEWDDILRNLKIEYGSLVCLEGQVAVLCDNKIIGGEKELRDMIESKYVYHLVLNYQKESVNIFANYVRSSGRPCAYMHISIDGKPIGSLIFMLYSDVVPVTCENFLRLCTMRRGGYSGTPIHRVVKDGWIQGGGFGLKNTTTMDCENFIVPQNKRGVLGMANAGRHIDCSTQFYVLLQPNEWLKSRFVAFGQLIDGEEILKKIEDVETYYESPAVNISIYAAGVVNLDCQNIRINKGALEYLDEHVDDLVTIGEIFYEILMEHLFLEIEFRSVQKMEVEAEGEGYGEAFKEIVDAEGNLIRKRISATRRFIRKNDTTKEDKFVDGFNRRKEDIEQNFGQNNEQVFGQVFGQNNEQVYGQDFGRNNEQVFGQHNEQVFGQNNEQVFGQNTQQNMGQQFDVMRVDLAQVKPRHETKSGSFKNTGKGKNDENKEFDVESYEYDPEEYNYQQVSPTSSGTPKEKRPYYIPFTDVPYPGEIDSNFDLKRLLQGDYCLESDLDPKQRKLEMAKKGRTEDKINAISGIISSYGGMRSEHSLSSVSLDSEDENDILDYLNLYQEKVSFSGNIIRHIAKKYMKDNPLEETTHKECFSDDDLRMVRMALNDFKSREHKKVSINVHPWATSTQIKRRQTGFAKPDDMAAIRFFQRDTDDAGEQEMEMETEEELDKRDAMKLEELKNKPVRAVSIVAGPNGEEGQKIERRPTGYYPSEVIQRTLQDEQGQEDVDNAIPDMNLRKVSIDISALKVEEPQPIPRKQTGYFTRDDFKITRDKDNTRSEKKSSVRILTGHTEAEDKETKFHYHDARQSMTRQSVLIRLLEDVADDDDESPPILKDYKSHETGKKQIKLAMSDTDINENTLIRKSTRLLHRASEAESNEALRKVASAQMYDKSEVTMEYVSREVLPTIPIRGPTRKKGRPTITVSQYKKMNEELRNEENKLQARKAEREKILQAQRSKKSSVGPPEDVF